MTSSENNNSNWLQTQEKKKVELSLYSDRMKEAQNNCIKVYETYFTTKDK